MIGVRREMSVPQRGHTMVVGEGLYVLRYVSTGAPNDAPVIRVTPSGNADGISLFSAPGGMGDGLTSPGECIVVRAEKSGALDLIVSANKPNGSVEAEVRLERIASSNDAISGRSSGDVRRSAGSAMRPDVEVMAHVSRRGDVVCAQGEWICGPDLPMAIEGLEIRWPNKPSGVDLRYALTVGRNRQRLQEAVAGQFAGTRGKATPIVGLTLALTGPRAADYELRADALFLGAQLGSKKGSHINFVGPAGREPLVGFRLVVDKADNRSEFPHEQTAPDNVVMKQVGGVRVYRPQRS